MSNSAAKKARRRSNLFENDYDELIFSSDPIKIKNVEVEKIKKEKSPSKKSTLTKQESSTSFGSPISSISVKCQCNKCGNSVEGTLIAVLYSPLSGLNTPFVEYRCSKCKHNGRRSVQSKALPPEQFDTLYF